MSLTDPGAKLKKGRARQRCCELEKCFYCDMPLAPGHDHDHFPVPFRFGGTDMVPCCKNCHMLKDRIPLDRWPVNEVELLATLLDVWHKLPPLGRVWIAKMMVVTYDTVDLMHNHIPDH